MFIGSATIYQGGITPSKPFTIRVSCRFQFITSLFCKTLHEQYSHFIHQILHIWHPHQEMCRQIQFFSEMSVQQKDACWEDELKPTIKQGLAALNEKRSWPLLTAMRRLMAEATPSKLNALIDELSQNGLRRQDNSTFTLCIGLLSRSKIEELHRYRHPEGGSLYQFARGFSEYFPDRLESLESQNVRNEWKRSLAFFFDLIPNVINTFLIAFSLYDIGKDPQSAFEANQMLDVYYKFVMLPTTIFIAVNIVFSIVSWQVYAITALIVLAVLLALIVYIKFIKPCPSALPHCQNLTRDAKLGYLCPVIGREHEIQRLITLFSNTDKNAGRHTIIVGRYGVGKTEIVKGLAQRIACGQVPPEMKNKKIFLINTASLVQGGMYGYADQVEYLLNRVKGYEEEVIFFFDEIHVALNNRTSLSDFLKPLLDRGGRNITCIAATTDEEYNRHIIGDEQNQGDAAFARRFERCNVAGMTAYETKNVLQELARTSNRGVLIDDDALDHLIERAGQTFPNRHHPGVDVEILTSAINAVATTYNENYVPRSLVEVRARMQSHRQTLESLSMTGNYGQCRQVVQEINSLQEEVNRIEGRLLRRTEHLNRFKRYLQLMRANQAQLKPLAANVGNSVDAFKKFFFEIEYTLPGLQRLIEEEEGALQNPQLCSESINVRVTENSVDEAIARIEVSNRA